MEYLKTLGESEYKVLEILNEDNNLTQRHIAKKAGISLGLTNIIIRRLVKKGFLKIKNMNKKSILYNLTPKALIEKSYRTYHYFEKTVKDVVKIREKIQDEIIKRNNIYVNDIIIIGNNEISEIARWAIQEMKLKYTIIKTLTENKADSSRTLVINCERNVIKNGNIINIYKIL